MPFMSLKNTEDNLAPRDDVAEVNIATGGMEAHARIVPGDDEGKQADYDDLKAALASAGVVFGVDEDALRSVLHKTANEWYPVASGEKSVDGEDAQMRYEFRTRVTRAARVDDNDKVNFWELDLFEPCVKDQVLVTKIPATPGTPGTNVRGEPVPPKAGRDKRLPGGKNVIRSEDEMQLIAAASGYVSLVGESVVVSDVLDIKGDVDMSTGNITFDGTVVVRGMVCSGMTVKATNNIEVFGLVESATLEAGDDIILHRGVCAMDSGRIRAGGNVTAQYIERADVGADGFIKANAIVHSLVQSGSYVLAEGEKGVILGGKCVAGEFISVQNAGAVSGVATELELGIPPERRERLRFLQTEIARIQAEIEKLKHLVKLLGSTNIPGEPDVRTKARENAVHSLQVDIETLPALVGEYGELFAQIETAQDGKVHVSRTAHKGVRILLGANVYQVTGDLDYVTFKMRDGRADYVPYAFSGVPRAKERPSRR